MGKSKLISNEALSYIKSRISEDGIVTVEGVYAIIEPLYGFDPLASKDRELKALARRYLASVKDAGGERSLLALKGGKGIYANLENCQDERTLLKIIEQLQSQYDGIGKTLTKAKKRQRDIEGQMRLFDDVAIENAAHTG